MMSMQEAIREFQESGNREIIDRVLMYTNINFLKNETLERERVGGEYKVRIDLPEPEMYIAYRVRFFLDKISRSAEYYSNEKEIDDDDDNDEDYDLDYGYSYYEDMGDYERYCEFMQLVDYVRNMLNLEGDPNKPMADHYMPYMTEKFDDLLAVKYEIKDYLEYNLQESWEGFYDDIEYFTNKNKSILDNKNQIMEELKTQYIIPALEYAFERVDYTRTDKEIVKYVNMAFLTHFVVEQNKKRGLIRLQRKVPIYTPDYHLYEDKSMIPKKMKNIYVEFKYSNAVKMVLNKNIPVHLPKVYKMLQTRQVKFLEEVLQAVEEEIKNDNKDAFKMDNEGSSILNYRYFANKLGIEESNFKHRLRRIRKKVLDNWDDVVGYTIKKSNSHILKTSHFHI